MGDRELVKGLVSRSSSARCDSSCTRSSWARVRVTCPGAIIWARDSAYGIRRGEATTTW